MISKIPSTKASPDDIFGLLKIVEDNTGNIEVMKSKIHEYLLKKSRRGKRDEYNSIYAICFPTLRRLNLIDGKGADVHLSPDGKTLVHIFKKKGELEYKTSLAKIFLRIDFEKAHVAKNLMGYKDNFISYDDLTKYLRSKGIDTNEKDDRLKKWLRFLKYVKFIEEKDEKIRINKFQINAILNGPQLIDLNKFLEVFIESYEKLKIKNRGSKYIKIPDLERDVCLRLEKYNFTTFDFRKNLVKLRGAKVKNKKILFSKPGAREEGGIKINGIYYYYISVFDTG